MAYHLGPLFRCRVRSAKLALLLKVVHTSYTQIMKIRQSLRRAIRQSNRERSDLGSRTG